MNILLRGDYNIGWVMLMKNISLRVEDDLHYKLKLLSLQKKISLQDLILNAIKKDLQLNIDSDKSDNK